MSGQFEMFGPVRVRPVAHDDGVRALAQQLPDRVYLGTSSWSFPGWRGQLWRDPVDKATLSRRGLEAYAAHPLFRTVSVDHTYYRMPAPGQLASLADQVPNHFRFVVKAPRHLTTAVVDGRQNADALSPELATRFSQQVREELGDRLGWLHLQFPPQPPTAFGPEFLTRLVAVLECPGPWAVEIRTPQWMGSDLCDVISQTAAVPCLTIHPSMPDLRTQWVGLGIAAASALVVRWNLRQSLDYETAKGRYAPFARLQEPDLEIRGQLARALAWAVDRGIPAWVIANNKAEGCAPATLQCLARELSMVQRQRT